MSQYRVSAIACGAKLAGTTVALACIIPTRTSILRLLSFPKSRTPTKPLPTAMSAWSSPAKTSGNRLPDRLLFSWRLDGGPWSPFVGPRRDAQTFTRGTPPFPGAGYGP